MCDGGTPSLRVKAFQNCSTSSGVQNWAPHNLEYIGTKHHLMFYKGCGTYWGRLGELLAEFYGGYGEGVNTSIRKSSQDIRFSFRLCCI